MTIFYPPEHFKWTTDLADNWTTIRDESEQLHEAQLTRWHEHELYSGEWDIFGLRAFGENMEENCKLCPVTTDLVTRIPGMTSAGFSILGPDTHIRPHVGYTRDVLRFHLGLSIPDVCVKEGTLKVWSSRNEDGKFWLTEHETFHLFEGSMLVFDDTKVHEAWNHSDETRTILLVDFARPDDLPDDLPDQVQMETTH